jgi:iron complex outermembrane receptor protein
MTTIQRALLLGSTGLFAMTAPAVVHAAAAEAPAVAAVEASGEGLEEIIVTAQKRDENLQKTPISISVLGAQDLTNRRVISLVDLGDGAIPSLRVAPFFSRPGALIINIRGIGVLSDSNQPARDQGVGVYVDGVYLGRAQGLGTALFDIKSIEVLKGPQGTLFGRNTIGGAVNIVTARPSGEFKMATTAGIGNHGAYKLETHIDLPEFANVSLKVDAVLAKRNGFVTNPLPGASDFNSYDKRGIRGEALWKVTPNFSADLAVDVSYDATSTLYQQFLSPGTGIPASATASAIAPNVLAGINPLQPRRETTAVLGVPQQPSVGKTKGGRFGLDWEVTEKLTLKSITAYRELTQTQYDNGSAIPSLQIPVTTANPTGSFVGYQYARYSLAPTRQNQFSQELQAIGEFDRVKYQFGALYYQERVQDAAQAFNTNQFTDAAGTVQIIRSIDYNAQVVQRASHVITTSIGAYGQATYNPPIVNDIFKLTLGGRWTRDKKEGSLFTINGAPPVQQIGGTPVVGSILLNQSWSRFDPLINLAAEVTDDVLVYGKWSTGYRSGGANSRSLSYAKFNPETVSMFEVGAKMQFLDDRARLNLAAYTGTYKDIQLDFSGLYTDIVNGVLVTTTRTTTNTVNAPGNGRLKGVEAELTVAPTSGLNLTASYAYNSVKIPDTINPFPLTGNNNQVLNVPIPIYQVYTPEHSFSGAVDYTLPMNGFDLAFHLDGNYASGFYVNYNDPVIDAKTGAVRFKQPRGDSGLVFNGRIAVADIDMNSSGAKLTIAFWARNLFNEQHVFYKSAAPNSGVSGFFNDPVTFGVDATIRM